MRCRLPRIASQKVKASDNNGIRAEDTRTGDETTKEMINQIFNEVMKQEHCTPETWTTTRLTEGVTWKELVTTPDLHSTLIYSGLEVLAFIPNAGSSCKIQTA